MEELAPGSTPSASSAWPFLLHLLLPHCQGPEPLVKQPRDAGGGGAPKSKMCRGARALGQAGGAMETPLTSQHSFLCPELPHGHSPSSPPHLPLHPVLTSLQSLGSECEKVHGAQWGWTCPRGGSAPLMTLCVGCSGLVLYIPFPCCLPAAVPSAPILTPPPPPLKGWALWGSPVGEWSLSRTEMESYFA